MADFAHDAAVGPAEIGPMQLLKGAEAPFKIPRSGGKPTQSGAVTVYLAGNRTLKLERISNVHVYLWER